ncbi:hypothetical protein [Xanthomonas maliensis]|uniref:hypothetical protein n=1 Tax=Xanthomonas maliensis TaxID=1321368 RepID=UPI00039B469C|nr:hypothetical protein [Xanthomonas maliensis]KAB7763847.1 hypothetical protein CKY51_19045 [Xanthomonas maliensis]
MPVPTYLRRVWIAAFRPLPPLLLLVLGSAPLAALAVTRTDADAFDADTGALRYRESHWLLEGGGRLVLYRCTDGRAFARKQVDGDGPEPDFELVDGRDGYREGVRRRNGRREMFQQRPGAAERSAPLPAADGPRVIDAGFDSYLRTHWEALASVPQRVAFVLPSLQRQLVFRIQQQDAAAGRQRYRLSLDTWYGAAVPAIELTYTSADRRLLVFRGVGNLRDASGHYPKVRIVFPDAPPRSVDAAEVQQARAQPLVAQCEAH